MIEEWTCGRCGIRSAKVLNLDTGGTYHAELRDCINALRAEAEEWQLAAVIRERENAATIAALKAENAELAGVIEKYGDDPGYARSRFRQIDLLHDQRAHDRLKIDGLQKRVAKLEAEATELRGSVFAQGIADERARVKKAIRDQFRRDADHVAPTTMRASDTTHDSEGSVP